MSSILWEKNVYKFNGLEVTNVENLPLTEIISIQIWQNKILQSNFEKNSILYGTI